MDLYRREMNLLEEMVDKLLDILADKVANRLQIPHKDLYSAKDLADRYGISPAAVRRRMAAGEFGELVEVGDRTRLVPWKGVQLYEAAHTGPSDCGIKVSPSPKRRMAPRGNPGPI